MENIEKKCVYNIDSTILGDAVIKFLYPKNNLKIKNKMMSDEMPHVHTSLEFFFVLSGECKLITESATYTLMENSVCIVPKGVIHSFGGSGEDSCYLSFLIDIEDYERETGKDFSEKTYYSYVCSAFENVLVFENCHKEKGYILDFISIAEDTHYDAANMRSAFLKLTFLSVAKIIADTLNLECKENGKKSIFNDGKTADTMLENFIMCNYTKNIAIHDVAEFVGYSVTYTARKIKKNYAMTYSELLIKLRMAYARKLIIFTDKSLSEISEKVGYNSYNGFGVAFKKFYKMSPDKMRIEIKGYV